MYAKCGQSKCKYKQCIIPHFHLFHGFLFRINIKHIKMYPLKMFYLPVPHPIQKFIYLCIFIYKGFYESMNLGLAIKSVKHYWKCLKLTYNLQPVRRIIKYTYFSCNYRNLVVFLWVLHSATFYFYSPN